MKRQITDWEKIFAKCVSDKELYPEYIMASKNSISKNKQHFEQYFTKEDIKMANKHTTKCSTSLGKYNSIYKKFWKKQNLTERKCISSFQKLKFRWGVDYKGAEEFFGLMELFCILIVWELQDCMLLSKLTQYTLRKVNYTVCKLYINLMKKNHILQKFLSKYRWPHWLLNSWFLALRSQWVISPSFMKLH